MDGCALEIGNGLEMRGLSVGRQEKMIKIGSDCAQFSHPPPTQRLHPLHPFMSVEVVIQRRAGRAVGGTGCKEEKQDITHSIFSSNCSCRFEFGDVTFEHTVKGSA